ncbi:hypothetical protein OnM2_016042 [Erysiphe neolycopersici]|uniref:Uncharacterized protein n=1 Tax=Erysiphe neolycopersici TaxID=212602 RepID=A0A420I4X8_9PEZI|nr:hypothetical protein OnM2_016042 [Erysiphe neolycopersici]
MSSTTSFPTVGNPKPNSSSDAFKNPCPSQVLEVIKNVSTTEETAKQEVSKNFQIIEDLSLKPLTIVQSITRIERYVNDNTCPLQIMGAIVQPKLQFNKNFDSACENTWTTQSLNIVIQAREALLDVLLQPKREEIEMMKKQSNIEIALKKGLSDLNDFYSKMITHILVDKRTTSTIAIILFNNVSSLRYSYREFLLKAAFLANGDYTRSLVKKVSKAESKKNIDVKTVNAIPSDVQTTIDAAVKRAVQALYKNKKTIVNNGISMSPNVNQTLLTTFRKFSKGYPQTKNEEGIETLEEGWEIENWSFKKGRKRKRE